MVQIWARAFELIPKLHLGQDWVNSYMKDEYY